MEPRLKHLAVPTDFEPSVKALLLQNDLHPLTLCREAMRFSLLPWLICSLEVF